MSCGPWVTSHRSTGSFPAEAASAFSRHNNTTRGVPAPRLEFNSDAAAAFGRGGGGGLPRIESVGRAEFNSDAAAAFGRGRGRGDGGGPTPRLEPVGRTEFNSDAAAAFGRGGGDNNDRHDDRGRSSGGGFDYAATSAFGGKRRAKYDDAPPPRANVAPPALRNNQLGHLLNEIMPVGDNNKEEQWTTSALRYKKKIVSPPTVITTMDTAFPALCAWDDSDNSKKSTPSGSTKTTPSSGQPKSTFADLMRKRVAEEEMDATLHQNNADMEALERQKNAVSLGPRIHMRRDGCNSYGGEGSDSSADNDDTTPSDYAYKRNGRFKSRMPADHELDVDGNNNCDAAYASDQDQDQGSS